MHEREKQRETGREREIERESIFLEDTGEGLTCLMMTLNMTVARSAMSQPDNSGSILTFLGLHSQLWDMANDSGDDEGSP